MRCWIPLSLFALFFASACGASGDLEVDSDDPNDSPKETGSAATWEELEEDDGSDNKDKGGPSGDTGKDSTCGEDVAEGAPCEGTWEETLCQDESGTYWWCENGGWTSKK